MKTLNEIKMELSVASNKINRLCKEIDKLKNENFEDEEININAEAIARRFPIEEHPINKKSEYVQKNYLTLLFSVAKVENNSELFESQSLFIARIVEGLDNKSIDIKNLYKNALELNEKSIDEYTSNLIEEELSSNFVVDSLILANLKGECSNKVFEYLSELFQLIKVSKVQIVELCQLSRLILEKNSSEYKVFCKKELNIDLEKFFFYINEFHQGIIVDNSKLFCIRNKRLMKVSNKDEINKLEKIKAKKIILENIILSEYEKLPIISSGEKVIISNCVFERNKKPLKLEMCRYIEISKCEFKELLNKALYLTKNQEVKIKDSNFNKCSDESEVEVIEGRSIPKYGGTVYMSRTTKATFEKCKFKECKFKQHDMSWAIFEHSVICEGIVAYIEGVDKLKIVECSFSKCNAYEEGSLIFRVNKLFELKNVKKDEFIDCTAVDSEIIR
ncbi:MAG: right-handed parallel beta-helix repeat-containing protein [Clostridium sp.]